MAWVRAVTLGLWLCVATIWPVSFVTIGHAHMLWQPALIGTLLLLMLARYHRYGWRAAGSQSLLFYVLFTLAGWLPFLRTTTYWTEYPYPRLYECYLYAYEGSLAALIAYAGLRAVRQRIPSWWNKDRWSRPLAVAPILLVIRGIYVNHWVSLLLGVAVGAAVGWFRPSRGPLQVMPIRRRWWIACGVFLAGAILVYGAGMRIYQETGAAYPSASDDGIHYLAMANKMAEQPGRFWTAELGDQTTFTGYYPLVALWFMVAGPDIPSLLIWHGVAGGLLALGVFWIGRLLCGTAGGIIAAGVVVADHIMLHLMGTVNSETFFIPILYLALLLWMTAREQPRAQGLRTSFLAGVAMGVATVFRPTSALMPLALVFLLWLERPKRSWRHMGPEAGRMLAGFAVPMALMVVRHRIAWGQWTLAGDKSFAALSNNYAFSIHGQHLTDIGVGAWSRLLAQEPQWVWQHMIPSWWKQLLNLWTHPGFGQMDLLQGLVHVGPYQAALTSILVAGILIGVVCAVRQRRRCDLTLLVLPLYFSALVFVFYVINSRYRAPYIPALYLLCCLGFSRALAQMRSVSHEAVVTRDSHCDA